MKQLIELCKKFNCKYLENEKMSLHTTFKIGGNARLVVYPQNEEQIGEFVKCAKSEKVRLIAIGNGSNLLVDDGGIDACGLILGEPFSDIRLIDDETIYAKAGAKLISLCRFAYEHSLSGLEFAYGIPGSAGGAAFMNAGAYGGEMKDVLTSVEYLAADGNIVEVPAAELDLSYRHSIFEENGGCILSATFRLKKGDAASIKARMDELMQKRIDKQPLDKPSAGSTFKRPEGHFAGKLIEDAGLKGVTVGGAQVSTLHSGFIINRGGATATDILQLISLVQNTVYDRFGVMLEPEVRIIG